jgi:hypothetical protein
MLIMFQMGKISIGYQILFKLQPILRDKNTVLLVTILDTLHLDIKKFTGYLCALGTSFYVIHRHPNKGMDIGPFLKQMEYVVTTFRKKQFDYIFKIHTKSDYKWLNEMIDPLIKYTIDNLLEKEADDNIEHSKDVYVSKYLITSSKWFLPIDNFNKSTINKICKNLNIHNIYYDKLHKCNTDDVKALDINVDFYSKYYGLKLNDCSKLNDVLGYDFNRQFAFEHLCDNSNIPSEKWIKKQTKIHDLRFSAGSIFIAKYKTQYKFYSSIDIDKIYEFFEIGYTTNEKSTFVHSWERIISTIQHIKYRNN